MTALEAISIEPAPGHAGRPFAVVAHYPERTIVVAYARDLNDAAEIVIGLLNRLASDTGAIPT